MLFKVIVADNFHHMDEDESYELGAFDSLANALGASRLIVDKFLASSYRPGMSSAELFDKYASYGEDPYIVPAPAPGKIHFSAWDYARARCDVLCEPGTGNK